MVLDFCDFFYYYYIMKNKKNMKTETFNYGTTNRKAFETIKTKLLRSGNVATMTYTNYRGKECVMTIGVEQNQYGTPVVVFYGIKHKYEFDFITYRFSNQFPNLNKSFR